MRLSDVLGRWLTAGSGEPIARVDDLVVRLRRDGYPDVTGIVALVSGRRVFLPVERIGDWASATDPRQPLPIAGTKLDLRPFERRDGEVLLRSDVLGHRLIDVSQAQLVKAWDVELATGLSGLEVRRLDTRRPARWFGLLRRGAGHSRDWKAFEPLLGRESTVIGRGPLSRLGRLHPAQIADLLEGASREERADILSEVHAHPELEADVFEELNPDTATRLLNDRPVAETAQILSRMRADDAADALAELPQQRRRAVLDALPATQRAKVVTLLGFNPASAGGIMTVDLLAVGEKATVSDALRALRDTDGLQPEALVSVHAVNSAGCLVAVAPLVRLVQADPDRPLIEVAVSDPVRVSPNTDLVDTAVLMADYNLLTIPVVDGHGVLLGLITIDDILEAVLPDDWRRRESSARPHQDLQDSAAAG